MWLILLYNFIRIIPRSDKYLTSCIRGADRNAFRPSVVHVIFLRLWNFDVHIFIKLTTNKRQYNSFVCSGVVTHGQTEKHGEVNRSIFAIFVTKAPIICTNIGWILCTKSSFTTVPQAPVTSKDKAPNAVLLQLALLLWIQTGLPVILPHSFVILFSSSRQLWNSMLIGVYFNIAVGLRFTCLFHVP